MLYREIIAVCSQIHTKHINTLCGQNVEFCNVKNLAVHIVTNGGTYSDHWALNGLNTFPLQHAQQWRRCTYMSCLPLTRSTPHSTEAVRRTEAEGRQLILGLHLPYAPVLCQVCLSMNAQFVNPIWHAASHNTSRCLSIKQHNTMPEAPAASCQVTPPICRHDVRATEHLTDKTNSFLFWHSILAYKSQQDAQVTELILSDNCSTCFGRHYYPSSGAQNNCNYSIW